MSATRHGSKSDSGVGFRSSDTCHSGFPPVLHSDGPSTLRLGSSCRPSVWAGSRGTLYRALGAAGMASHLLQWQQSCPVWYPARTATVADFGRSHPACKIPSCSPWLTSLVLTPPMMGVLQGGLHTGELGATDMCRLCDEENNNYF